MKFRHVNQQSDFLMCRRKRKYSQRDAVRTAHRMNERQLKPVHAYFCPICRQNHVGYDTTEARLLFSNQQKTTN